MRPPIAAPDGSSSITEPPKLIFEKSVELNYRLTLGEGLQSVFRETVNDSQTPFTVFSFAAIVAIPVFYGGSLTSALHPFPLVGWSFCIALGAIFLVIGNLVSFLVSARASLGDAVILTPDFLVKRKGKNDIFVPWPKIRKVKRWLNGFVYSQLMDGVFIPFAAFRSTDEAQEFFEILQTLHKSHGVAWQDEWNGKTFGFPPQNGFDVSPNLPK